MLVQPLISVYVTYPDQSSAEALTSELLVQKLVASVNLFSIKSGYWWNGQINQHDEWVSLMKTRVDLWPSIAGFIEKKHPYDIPCILKYDIEANESYKQWVVEVTR